MSTARAIGKNGYSSKEKHRTLNANPPILTVLLVLAISLASLCFSPNVFSTIDEDATIETLTTPLFEEYISRFSLGCFRILFSVFAFSLSLYKIFKKDAVSLSTNYLKETKLRSIPITLIGMKTQYMFTSWSWNLLALCFGINGTMTLLVEYDLDHLLPPQLKVYLMRAGLLLFEISAPTAMLVSFIVRYALWPNALRNGQTDSFKTIPSLLQHNANAIAALMEAGLLGGLPVRETDIIVAPLFGCAYIVFSWCMIYKWVPSKEPQFVYFFLDTTLRKRTTTVIILCLVFILMAFYGIFTIVDDILSHMGGGLLVHSIVVFLLSSMVCRFSD